MAHLFTPPDPLFCLGGTLYPVDRDFDWSHDQDVLLDAVKQTHEAMRLHHWATLTPNRSWLDCECIDPSDHRDLLLLGHASLVGTVMTLAPDAPRKHAWRFPVNAPFLRIMQGVAVVTSAFQTMTQFHLLPLL